jgi:ABC-type dipeptide/oligopeptide/nickel transport system ATPase subunit
LAGCKVIDRDIIKLTGSELCHFRRRIQMVFQDPYKSLNPQRRVGASLIEGPVEHGMPRQAAIARAAENRPTTEISFPESVCPYGCSRRICMRGVVSVTVRAA